MMNFVLNIKLLIPIFSILRASDDPIDPCWSLSNCTLSNSYWNFTGRECALCPPGSTSTCRAPTAGDGDDPATSPCRCASTKYGDPLGQDECRSCPGPLRVFRENTDSRLSTSTLSDCRCGPGSYRADVVVVVSAAANGTPPITEESERFGTNNISSTGGEDHDDGTTNSSTEEDQPSNSTNGTTITKIELQCLPCPPNADPVNCQCGNTFFASYELGVKKCNVCPPLMLAWHPDIYGLRNQLDAQLTWDEMRVDVTDPPIVQNVRLL